MSRRVINQLKCSQKSNYRASVRRDQNTSLETLGHSEPEKPLPPLTIENVIIITSNANVNDELITGGIHLFDRINMLEAADFFPHQYKSGTMWKYQRLLFRNN